MYYICRFSDGYMGVGTGGAQGARAPPPNNFAKWNFPYTVCTLIKEIGA